MKETEITVQVYDSIQNVKKSLISQGFQVIEEYDVNDWYFSKYDTKTLEKMEYIDILNNSFLVREILDDNPRCFVTYKKKELDNEGNVISEEKINSKIDSLENALKIFQMSGLNNWIKMENSSIVFNKGDIEIVLQDIKDLGVFIEFEENASMQNMTEKEKFNHMRNILKMLNLNLGDDFSCKKVYMKFKK